MQDNFSEIGIAAGNILSRWKPANSICWKCLSNYYTLSVFSIAIALHSDYWKDPGVEAIIRQMLKHVSTDNNSMVARYVMSVMLFKSISRFQYKFLNTHIIMYPHVDL